MARRFSRYRLAYKLNEGATAGPLKKWDDFRKGTSPYTRTAPTGDGTKTEYMLIPFSVDLGVGKQLAVQVTNRAITRATAIAVGIAELGLTAINTANTVTYGITPATLQGAKSSAATAEISKITGVKYTKTKTDAFSAPFGRKTAAELFGERILAIRDLVKDNGASVSFRPERLLFN